MSESESDEIYFEIQDESIRETLEELPYIMQVFHPLYDLNETVGSDIDFILGAVFGQILSHSSWLYYVRRVKTKACPKLKKLFPLMISIISHIRIIDPYYLLTPIFLVVINSDSDKLRIYACQAYYSLTE